MTGSQREYIEWMLTTCAADTIKVDNIFNAAAVDLLAARLRTPLQIEQRLTHHRGDERPADRHALSEAADAKVTRMLIKKYYLPKERKPDEHLGVMDAKSVIVKDHAQIMVSESDDAEASIE